MKAFVTSIGEPTTKLCVWSLRRNGFDVVLLEYTTTSLWEKMKAIFEMADDDFVRVDADIIPNRNFTAAEMKRWSEQFPNIWWWQFITFDWLKLDITHSMSFIKKDALPALRARIEEAMNNPRPETYMSRIPEFYNPRRFETYPDKLFGLHGYKGDLKSARKIKTIRNQMDLYDFEMAERLNEL